MNRKPSPHELLHKLLNELYECKLVEFNCWIFVEINKFQIYETQNKKYIIYSSQKLARFKEIRIQSIL